MSPDGYEPRAPLFRGWLELAAHPLFPLAPGCRRWVLNLDDDRSLVVVSSVDAFPDRREWHVSISLATITGPRPPDDEQVAGSLDAFGMSGATEDNSGVSQGQEHIRHFWKRVE
jgi:hypothetical protein